MKIIPVWISGTLWFTAVAELTNYTFLQASTMDLHMGRNFTIPPVSIVAVFYLAVALFVPLYDLLIARAARRQWWRGLVGGVGAGWNYLGGPMGFGEGLEGGGELFKKKTGHVFGCKISNSKFFF